MFLQSIFPELELLLHPRVPPLVRSLPHVETLSLFRAEESQEEVEARQALELATQHDIERKVEAATQQPSTTSRGTPTGPFIQPPLATTRAGTQFAASMLSTATSTTLPQVQQPLATIPQLTPLSQKILHPALASHRPTL